MKLCFKITALLLCICLLIGFSACSKNQEAGVPNGMKNVTVAGEDFRLYVPSSWTSNTVYGVSGAYFTMTNQSTVSAVKYAITDDMTAQMTAAGVGEGSARLDWFWQTECLEAINEVALGGSVTQMTEEQTAFVLDSLNAHRYHTTATVHGNVLHFVHAVAEKSGAFYVITFTIANDLYANLISNIDSILDVFLIMDTPYLPEGYMKSLEEDVEVPEGMMLASNNDVAYRFYVPTNWKINREEGIFSAYLESDRSSVSVIPYMPDVENMSVADFFAESEKMMKNLAGEGGYTFVSAEEQVDLGGRQATAYTYRFKVGGNEYYYKQVIAARGSMMYSLTYTAPSAESFAAHMGEVDRMIAEFTFR